MTTLQPGIVRIRKYRGVVYYQGKVTVREDGRYLYTLNLETVRLTPADALADAGAEVERIIESTSGLDLVKV